MNSYSSNDTCLTNKKNDRNASFPVDSKSLYNDKIYDTQTAHRTCYESNPVQITEGFGTMKLSFHKLLRYAIYLVIAFIVFLMVNKVTDGAVSGALGLDMGSNSDAIESLSEMSFLN
jgi:hypothetical protein